MAENTTSARCTEAEWKAATTAGLPFAVLGTTAQERAIHAFAQAIRAESAPLLRDALSDIDSLLDYVGESNAIRMVGANETYNRARVTMDRIDALLSSLAP